MHPNEIKKITSVQVTYKSEKSNGTVRWEEIHYMPPLIALMKDQFERLKLIPGVKVVYLGEKKYLYIVNLTYNLI